MDAWMRPLATGLACCLLLISNLSCSVNALKTFANTKTDQALLVDAQIQVDSANYSAALTDIASMTTTYATSADTLRVKASAYGGLCGFNFLTFVQAFSSIGATRLMPFLLAQFPTATTTTIDNCISAQTTMEAIAAKDLTANDEAFLALISLAKIGAILSYYDGNDTATVNTNYNACTDPGAPEPRTKGGDISDSDAREIGSGLSVALVNLQAVSGSMNLGSGSISSIQNECNLAQASGFCSITDPTLFSTNQVKAIRSFVAEDSAIGIGQTQSTAPGACPGAITACYCP